MDVWRVRTAHGRTYRIAAPADEIVIDTNGNIYYAGTSNRYALVDGYGNGVSRPYWSAGTDAIYDPSYTNTNDRYSEVVAIEITDHGSVNWDSVYPVLAVGLVFCVFVIMMRSLLKRR